MTSDLQPQPPRPSSDQLDPRRWKALALLCVAYFMVIVDSQIVILALPEIERDLGMTPAGSTWVMSAYLLSLGGLLLLGGRTADILGGRRMFVVGTTLFIAASVACGLSRSGDFLIGARVVQGAAAALMAPTAMSILMSTFGEGAERNKALGIWTGVGAFGATAALLIGGPITDGLGWEWIFFINVPLGLLVVLLAPRLLNETTKRGGRFDLLGATLATAAVASLVYTIVKAPAVGWTDPQTLGVLALSVALTGGFVMAEGRASAPLVPLRIFRSPTFVGGNLIVLLVAMALYGGALITSLYAQQVLGYTAVVFGLSTAIYAAMSIVGSNVAGRLVTTIGFRSIAMVGTALMAVGLILLSYVSPGGTYWVDLFPGLVVFGAGIGASVVAGSVAALSGARPEESGLASGINNAVFQVGAALGVAVASSVAAANTSLSGDMAAMTDGFRAAFLACAVVVLLALVCAALTRARTVTDERDDHKVSV